MKNGFVMAELLVVLLVIAVLAVLAAPAYQNFITQNRLTAAAESLYSDLQLARSEAIRKQSNVYVIISTGSSWCYGLSDTSSCNCATSGSCKLNNIERVVSYSNYPGVSISTTGLSGNTIQYEGVHGSTGVTGQVNFTANSSTTISTAVKPMGNVRICSSDIGGYSSC